MVRTLGLAASLAALVLAYCGADILQGGQHVTAALSIFGVGILLLSLANLGRPLPSIGPVSMQSASEQWADSPAAPWERIYWLLLLATAAVLALLFRFYELPSKPYGIWFDEAQNGIVARDILHGARPIFVGDWSKLPALFFYVFAVSLKLFGDDIFALRLVSTAAGLGAVGFTYLLGKELFGVRGGVIAAFLLAVMRWHVNFSRFAMHGIFAPLFEVIVLYFLVRGLKQKGVGNFVVSGMAVGIGLQGYYAFIIVPATIVVLVLHHALFEKTMPLTRLAQGFAILVLASIVVYAPLGFWAVNHWKEFNERSRTVSIINDRTMDEVIDVVMRSTRQHLLMFNAAGDRNGRHNIPNAPMLDEIMGGLFVLGTGFALLNVRRSSCFLLVAWAVLALQAGIWSLDFEAPQAYRTVGITPAIALLAALPLDRLWVLTSSTLAGRERFSPRRWLTPAVAVVTMTILLVSAWRNFNDYFRIQLQRSDTFSEYSADATFAATEIARYASSNDISVTAVWNDHPTIRFLNPAWEIYGVKTFDWSLSVPSTSAHGQVYLLDSAKLPFWQWLHSIYPGGTFSTLDPPGTEQPAIAYEAVISEQDVQQLRGLQATYFAPGASPFQERVPVLDLDWSKKRPPVRMPFTAVWQGTLRLRVYGECTLSFDLPGFARLNIDGQNIASGSQHIAWKGRLYKGDHALRIKADIERQGFVRLRLNGATVPAEMFLNYPAQGHGLVATFYGNDRWEGPPKLVELEPFVAVAVHSELDGVVGRPFSAIWTGFLDVPEDGDYVFVLEAAEHGSLKIDSVVLNVEEGEPHHLTKGRHPIEVRLLNRGGGARAFLYWQTPTEHESTVIPPRQFYPR
jgi:uncharacterized membrane protein